MSVDQMRQQAGGQHRIAQAIGAHEQDVYRPRRARRAVAAERLASRVCFAVWQAVRHYTRAVLHVPAPRNGAA